MNNIPILWGAAVMKDGAAYIKFSRKQCSPKIVNSDVLQMDMTREDVIALRDVLTVALQNQ